MSTLTPSHLQGTSVPGQPQHHGAKVKVVAGYALQQRLGSGSFATVYKGFKVSSEDSPAGGAEHVAIKAISRTSEKLTRKVLDNLELEISILRTYRHPNIVCLHDVQKTDRHFYLILEYCGGGDLQKLIRTRKNGRLSERLTRRLMRDLASGLHFLWGQELIHRDIKPQNLLLTGPLPLDEVNDPAKMDAHEEMRQKANFPSTQFALKIADFGFARQLQTTSLAETLCGSPLYMAPEILQHQRYDAKADLWSVGTVLFEMISGRPPFNGENHIDLLRNIQRKAVRLPPDVRVSKECVALLRLLLNRNPLSRAGFKEFFHACEALVALGCEGVKSEGDEVAQPTMKMDLGTIHEADDVEDTHGAASMMTTATTHHHTSHGAQPSKQKAVDPTPSPAPTTDQSGRASRSSAPIPVPTPGFVTPPFGPMLNPPAPFSSPPSGQLLSTARNAAKNDIPFAPLEPSPPQTPENLQFAPTRIPPLPLFEERATGGLASGRSNPISGRVLYGNTADTVSFGRHDLSPNASDDGGFVMVEHGSVQRTDSTSNSSSGTALVASGTDSYSLRRDGRNKVAPSPPMSPLFYGPKGSVLTTRGEYLLVSDTRNRQVPKGMLSTSPGTGGALVGMMGGSSRPRLMNQGSGSLSPSSVKSQIETVTMTIATVEDVGRRAVSVAHLGDTRAFLAMRLSASSNEEGPLLLSAAPMEGVEEESDEHSSANVTDTEAGASSSTQVVNPSRGRSISTDRSMPDVAEGASESEEMPFAFAATPDLEPPPKELSMRTIPSRSDASSVYRHSSGSKQSRAQPETIHSHYGEALSCYLKALSMLKGIVNAVQKVRSELDMQLGSSHLSAEQQDRLKVLLKRCDVTSNWLSGQFAGVLERADAANVEMGKLSSSKTISGHSEMLPLATVEELIYNQSLACGRDAAVKQLLGQYEAARTCYRSAGLLAETLLMEQNIQKDDRRLLEGYVDGFADRITELDRLMLQQSQSRSASNNHGSSIVASKRGSGVIGIIGDIPQSSSDGEANPPFLC